MKVNTHQGAVEVTLEQIEELYQRLRIYDKAVGEKKIYLSVQDGELVVDVYFKPVLAVDEITLDFVVTEQETTFADVMADRFEAKVAEEIDEEREFAIAANDARCKKVGGLLKEFADLVGGTIQ